MSVESRIHQAFDLFHIRLVGCVRLSEIHAGLEHAASLPGYRPGMNEIGDMRAVTEVDIEFRALRGHVKSIVERLEDRERQMTVCLLVAGDYAFGMARMLQTLADTESGVLTVLVARTAEEAEGLMGLPKGIL